MEPSAEPAPSVDEVEAEPAQVGDVDIGDPAPLEGDARKPDDMGLGSTTCALGTRPDSDGACVDVLADASRGPRFELVLATAFPEQNLARVRDKNPDPCAHALVQKWVSPTGVIVASVTIRMTIEQEAKLFASPFVRVIAEPDPTARCDFDLDTSFKLLEYTGPEISQQDLPRRSGWIGKHGSVVPRPHEQWGEGKVAYEKRQELSRAKRQRSRGGR